MKKLWAIVLFVFVASLFAASAAFAVAADTEHRKVDPHQPVIAASSLPNPKYFQRAAGFPALSFDAHSNEYLGNWSWANIQYSLGSADFKSFDVVSGNAISLAHAKTLAGVFTAPDVRDKHAMHLHKVWSADGGSDAGNFVMVKFPLSNDLGTSEISSDVVAGVFYGKRAGDLVAVKAMGSASTEKETFTMVYDPAKFANMTSAVVVTRDVDGTPTDILLGENDRIGEDADANYWIVLCIKNNETKYDLISGDYVIDPSFVVAKAPLFAHAVPKITGVPTTQYDQAQLSPYSIRLNKLLAAGTLKVGTNAATEEKVKKVSDAKYYYHRYVKSSVLTDFGFAAEDVQLLPGYYAIPTAEAHTLVVLFTLDANKFDGKKVSEIKAALPFVDASYTVTRKDFTPVFTGATLLDGCSAVVVDNPSVSGVQDVLGADEVIDKTKNYYIALAIKDDGDFDFHKTNSRPAQNEIVALPFVYAVGSTPVEPALVVTPASASMKPGESQTFTAKVENSDKTFGFKWSSDNTDVATVGEDDGVVVAVKVGEAKIKCVATEVATAAAGIAEEPLETEVPVTVAQDAPSGGSSGGCSVGGFAPATLLLLAPLFLLLKK